MVKRIALRLLLVFGVFVLILVLNFVIFQRTAIKVTEGEPIENRDPDRVALLVIDIQEGTTGSISVTEGYMRQADFFIAHVNKLVAEGVEKGWIVIWVRSEVNNPLINILNNTLARGTKGAELDERLDTSVGQVLVKKKSDSFNDTALDAILEANDIGRLVLAGLDAEHCVYSTVRAAAKRGYKLEVFEESVIAEDASDLPGLLETYQALGVELRSMKELGDL